ncbi:MAG: M20/M25/M40 family metallo-hydrolase [Deltaproteobacteria bacterium]|jgi:tripeptide aminopeptidase|nr:M20/M25/M40 family metallo-hydrolase [Deltaproteobacteria bacterium]
MRYPPILKDFLEMVELPSNSFSERLLADYMKRKLSELGCLVEEDQAGEKIGGDCGNIIARWPGSAKASPILFSAHLDRVDNPGCIKAVVKMEDDLIVSDGTTILGADDATGLAAIIDGLRRIKQDGLVHGEVEIVLSVAEEVGLKGAKNLDCSQLKSKIGYVLDSAGPIGHIVNRAPTHKLLEAVFKGISSHAGVAPEKGLNAIKVAAAAITRIREGRLSPITTSNFGVIEGGKATNIVCDLVTLKGEVRSHDLKELEYYIAEVNQIFEQTASEFATEVELSWSEDYAGFYVVSDAPAILLVSKVLKSLGRAVEIKTGGGGMDGNIFNHRGITCVGLGSGCDNFHSPAESQSLSDLILCGRLVAGLIEAAAAGPVI